MQSLIRAMAASTSEMIEIFGDDALLRAALRFESELAQAQAAEGLMSGAAADLIEACCREPVDIATIAAESAQAGTLAIPLVRRLRERVAMHDPQVAAMVHRGGTSQDLADVALVLQSKAAMVAIERDTRSLCEALAGLTREHGDTAMIGRTLLQGALPITFGLKTANWLLGIDDALARSRREAAGALVLQFGGATGSLADLDGKALAVSARLAAALGLADPPMPWQSRRGNLAGLACALAILTGSVGKIARDVSLLAQNEVAEAFEPVQPGRGGSSAMAHKRNPTGCQVALSAALRAPGLATTMIAGLPQEHERGLGGWQADASVLADLFGLAHGAVAAMLPVIERLDVRPDRMRDTLARADVGVDTGLARELAIRALAAYEKGH